VDRVSHRQRAAHARRQAEPRSPQPPHRDGKPDFSGVWRADGYTRGTEAWARRREPCSSISRTRSAAGRRISRGAGALYDKRKNDLSKDNPDARCLPLGPLQMLAHPLPKKILQDARPRGAAARAEHGVPSDLHDGRPGRRRIRTRAGTATPPRVGKATRSWSIPTGLRDGLWADFNGSPLSDQETIRERFRRPNYGTLLVDVTVNDPKAYTKPFHGGGQQPARPRHRPARIRLPRETKRTRPGSSENSCLRSSGSFRPAPGTAVLRSPPRRRIESWRESA
jgi:hypothetical protein